MLIIKQREWIQELYFCWSFNKLDFQTNKHKYCKSNKQTEQIKLYTFHSASVYCWLLKSELLIIFEVKIYKVWYSLVVIRFIPKLSLTAERSILNYHSIISTWIKSSFWDLEDTEGSWLELGILILIWIWALVFGRSMFQILDLYLNLKVQRTPMS